ncbi:hypothetical protein Pyn_38217 [Prunus yedoensis var. nudiflora]|uniref:Uncharacterized protein n=1 Tax=Prunus yedoensis var. nudiflora TaxID=2094558 RepID=A0A314XYP8_PRUYE|nr:hypothetical protein Pyn_38217 [Prunus yedoensis var. nudiflora]
MDKRITEILAIPFVNPKPCRHHHGNKYPSNRNFQSCYIPWQNAFDKHVSLKVAASFRYERDVAIRASWDIALEAFEASLEPFKMKVDLFLPESNVVMLKLKDATNLKCLFEMHRDHFA